MPHKQKRKRTRRESGGALPTGDSLLGLVLSALEEVAAQRPPERAYEAIVEAAARGLGGWVSLWRHDEEDPVLLACAGADGETPRDDMLRDMKEQARNASQLSLTSGPLVAKWVDERGRKDCELACVPVAVPGESRGALVCCHGAESDQVTPFLSALGAAASLAVEKASLHDNVAQLSGKLAASERTRDPAERYAAVGQLAAHTYQELDGILDAVSREISRRARVVQSEGMEECLAELHRARVVVREQLDLARLEMPTLAMKDLNLVAQECLRELETQVREKRLRLMKKLSSSLPALLLDEEKVKKAVHKVLAAAVGRSDPEGWVRVETGVVGGDARFQVTWQEKGTPGSATDDMFVPFNPLAKGGMGLALASQIIREHGGGVRVQRYQTGSTALVIDLPVKTNQDRRHKKSRRSGLDRRRPKES